MYVIGELKSSLAVVVLLRWLSLAQTFGSFRLMGTWLLPIMRSFRPLGGIILITLFVFVGLTIAFLPLSRQDCNHSLSSNCTTLDTNKTDTELLLTFTALTYQMLFLADSDSIPVSISGPLNYKTVIGIIFFVISTMGFGICLLNLFIAVHGESYDQAQETAEVDFVQTRAKLCASVFVQPYIPKEKWDFGSRRVLNAVLIRFIGFVVWFALMLIPAFETATLVPSLVLFVVQVLSDMALCQRPWWNHDRCARQPCARCKSNHNQVAENHLWMCHRRDNIEADILLEDSEASIQSANRGRFGNLKFDTASKMRKITTDISALHSSLDEGTQTLKSHVREQLDLLSSLRRVLLPALAASRPERLAQEPPDSPDDVLDMAMEPFSALQPWGGQAGQWTHARHEA